MKTIVKLSVLMFSIAIMSASCVSKKKFTALEEAKNEAMAQLREAKQNITSLEDMKAKLESDLKKVQQDLDDQMTKFKNELADCEKRALMSKEEATQREAKIKELNSAIGNAMHSNAGVAMSEKDGSLYLVMDNNILYRSGSARVGKEGRAIIKKMANVLKSHPSVGILIESHTDHKKMVEGSIYEDNWDLSARRSNNVVRLLTKYGVAPNQVGASARAEYKPVHKGDDLTAEQLKENRRTEFMILPNLSGLYNMK